jgi:acyl-[acyl-carrier-protein]-phospholipid O-acyltransferase / long-chain-fatty-acid--[acyl-carrier-protein] ligase
VRSQQFCFQALGKTNLLKCEFCWITEGPAKNEPLTEPFKGASFGFMISVTIARILRFALRLLFRVKVLGEWKPVSAERLIILANHPSALDPLLLGVFLPVKPMVVVPEEDRLSWGMRALLAAIPHVELEIGAPASLKKLVELSQAHPALALFPEGRISRTGGLMKILEVPALAVLRSRVCVVPVHLDGPERSHFSHSRSPTRKRWFPRITLRVHPPVRLAVKPGARARRFAGSLELRRLMQDVFLSTRPKKTLFEVFLDTVAVEGRNSRIIEDVRERPESYGELLKKSLAFARGANGFSKEGEAIGILLPNSIPTTCLTLGLTAAGRIPAMLNYSGAFDSACRAAQVRTVITSRRFLAAVKLDLTQTNLYVIYLEEWQDRWRLADTLWLLCSALLFPRRVVKRRDPNSPAVILFTSGSEGGPKGVVLSHAAIIANIWQIRSVIDFSRADKFLNALPLYHAFGLTVCTIMPLLTGTRLMLYPTPLHYRAIPKIVYRRDCTCLFGTSTFLGQYALHADSDDFSSIRYVVSGGEKLNAEVARLWLDKFALRIVEGYGTTECSCVLALNTPLAHKAETVGRFLPGVQHRIEPVPGMEKGGILHVRGPNLMLGYLRGEQPGVLEPAQSAFGEGWYSTRDVVEVDEEGFVRINGRVKRFAKVAGEMVSLEAVESVATRAAPQQRHAATLQTRAQRGEQIILYTTDPQLTRIQLHRTAKSMALSERVLPARIIHVDEIPLLGSGKIDYVSLSAIGVEVHEPVDARS